jgi:hypothetical protein
MKSLINGEVKVLVSRVNITLSPILVSKIVFMKRFLG